MKGCLTIWEEVNCLTLMVRLHFESGSILFLTFLVFVLRLMFIGNVFGSVVFAANATASENKKPNANTQKRKYCPKTAITKTCGPVPNNLSRNMFHPYLLTVHGIHRMGEPQLGASLQAARSHTNDKILANTKSKH